MLRGEKVTLRAPKREDLPRIAEFRNDVEFELLGGGEPWWPVPFEVIEARAEKCGPAVPRYPIP